MRWPFAWVILVCAFSSAAVARENHALLVGVSTYETLDEQFWLVGPANDVALVRDYLTTNPHVPFPAGNITVLADGVEGRPTLAAIRTAMEDLARAAGPDDFVYLHFSGHGTQAPASDDENELDGLDELFLPVDIGPWNDSVGEVENALVDDEIGQMIGAIRAKGATVWAVFDSCHSGTVTRAIGAEDVRLRRLSPEALGIPDTTSALRSVTPKPESGVDPVPAEGAFVAFYAAQTNETTPEKRLPRGMPGRKSHGVFTFTLFEALAANPGITYRQLAQDVLRRYAVGNLARSTPLFEGNLDLAVFGTKGGAPVRQWPLEISEGVITIPAGHLHGIEDGMALAVLATAAGSDEAALGRLQVDFAETFQSELTPVDLTLDDIPRGAFARLVAGTTRFGLSVALPEETGPLADALKASVAVGSEAGLFGERVQFLPAGDDADLILTEAEDRGTILILPGTGVLTQADIRLTPRITTEGKTELELAEALADTLHAIARVQNLLKLGSAFAGDALDVDIALQTRSPSQRRLTDLETVPVPTLIPDDEIHALIRNHEDFPVDLNVLYVGSDYSITHMYSGRLQPGDRLKQGLLRITDEAFGRDRLVVLLTPAGRGKSVEDLGFLAQDELPALRAVGSEFQTLLIEAGFGTTLRAATPLGGGTQSGTPALLVFDLDTAAEK